MYHKIRHVALKAITNSPLESTARKVYGTVFSSKANKYDRMTFKIMRSILEKDSSCIDIGAYRGEILEQMKKISPDGSHFAFEPTPVNYEYLRKKFADVELFNCALSDKSGEMKFNYVVGRPARSGLAKLDYPDKNQQVKEIKIKVNRLDDMIPQDANIDLIKIDVEGAECLVLKGAAKLVKRCKPYIIFEHNAKNAAHYGVTPEELYELITKKFGLKIFSMSEFMSGGRSYQKKAFLSDVAAHDEFNFIAKP